MATQYVTVLIQTDATSWWVVVEPGGFEFQSPTTTMTVGLPTGVPHALIYYAQVSKGDKIKIEVTSADARVILVEREIKSTKLAYGHKGFKL